MVYWFFLGAVIAALIASFLAGRLPSQRAKGWPDHLGAVQAFLTVTAIFIAAAWFFIERPNSAKIRIDQAAQGYALEGERVLITMDVSLTNVGTTVLTLSDAELQMYVQQITPLRPRVEKEFDPQAPKGDQLIHAADNWSRLARLPQRGPASRINSVIESGEAENLYFRVILPCEPNLRVAVSTRLKRPKEGFARPLLWIKQTSLDLTQQCSPDGDAK